MAKWKICLSAIRYVPFFLQVTRTNQITVRPLYPLCPFVLLLFYRTLQRILAAIFRVRKETIKLFMAYPPNSTVTYNKAKPLRSEAGVHRGMCLLKAVKQIPNEITLTWKKRDRVS